MKRAATFGLAGAATVLAVELTVYRYVVRRIGWHVIGVRGI